ncbi:NudE-like protein 1a [Sarcoptes scabiei]|nr:NudE-like protein 1a [Sarcoptes scabiei]
MFKRTLRLSKLLKNQINFKTTLPNQKQAKFPIAGVKNVILVSSSKGGVGKSMVSVNLAYSIKAINEKIQVGILDADVFGPSLPTMVGLAGKKPAFNKQNLILPLVNYGVKCMSMGFLVDEENPIVWRGLMVMSAINRLLRNISWGELDLLVIDMPPGTGDTQLSIIQSIPIDGVVIVATPQKICLIDAIRGANMFRKMNVQIIGCISNMNHFVCHNCSQRQYLFDSDKLKLEEKLDLPILAEIPFDKDILKCSDEGCPIIIKSSNHPVSILFKELSEKVIAKLKF